MEQLPKIVQQRLQATAAAGVHPDPDLLTAFAEKSLTERERTQVLQHLGQCADCRQVVALAMPEMRRALSHSSARPVVQLAGAALGRVGGMRGGGERGGNPSLRAKGERGARGRAINSGADSAGPTRELGPRKPGPPTTRSEVGGKNCASVTVPVGSR